MPKKAANKRERGSVVVEFILIAPFLVITLLGVVGVGFTLGRSIQVNQVTRDAAKLFFDGVDLSTTGNQKIVGRLGWGMGLASDASGTINTAGKGVVILTQVIHVGTNECLAAGYTTNASCPNFDQLVIEKRIVVGNATLRASNFGSPGLSLLQADGSIRPLDYCTDASVLVPAGSAPTLLNLAQGQFSFDVESYFTLPELAGFLGSSSYSFLLM